MSQQLSSSPAATDAVVLAERASALRRCLRGLPDEMLGALAAGLEKHGDDLVPGRLYASPGGGGCAVGVMLRELEPARYDRGRARFWLRDRWRRGARSYRGRHARHPRLWHLEWIFDDAVGDLRRGDDPPPPRVAARVAGAWVLAEARAEIQWRSLQRAGPPSESRSAPRLRPPSARTVAPLSTLGGGVR
jgi:hypothetical protein